MNCKACYNSRLSFGLVQDECFFMLAPYVKILTIMAVLCKLANALRQLAGNAILPRVCDKGRNVPVSHIYLFFCDSKNREYRLR